MDSLHSGTPTLHSWDPRKLPVRTVGYLHTVTNDASTALISRQHHDPAGWLVEQWDPRLSVPCLTTAYRLDGEALKIDSVDAGWRLTLPGLAGEPLQRWDERGSHWHTTFDEQLRVMAVEENGEPNVDVFTYADASADAGYNRRGQLLEHKDRSGSLSTDSFSLTGQALKETRTFHDDQAFTSLHVFSPLGALLEQTDAGGHQRRSRYGLAGQLKQGDLLISGTPDWQPVLRDAQYNANDQIIEQLAGNRVLSEWAYDPADGRLHTQSSRKDGGAVLQNLEYFYDPVGNITRIEDHAFQPRYFANQLIDGHRDFTYDSLYRLTSATGYDDAPPPDIPGLPLPSDPNNRLNYTQTYKYDSGSNLIELCHVRAGNNSTRHMRIDPNSNRGVRWTPGEPEPVFDELFDPHGNQRSVQPGQPLQWNVRDELEKVTLISRENARSDAEHYRYSQGVRVFKRHETFAANAEHFHQVRYLPGLEIRTRDNGEELHVISLGNARCLHWAKNKPKDINDDQLRYNLEDHLGSSVMELDQDAVMISQEGYYPFGETAWMAPNSETTYRFIRYSGKEMDVSGLYYYGARYYAPWLQRWVSADPAGDVDGLNLYAMVSNNPMIYVDTDGRGRFDFSQIIGAFRTTANVASQAHDAATEFDGPDDEANVSQETRARMTFRRYLFSKNGLAAFGLGFTVGAAVGGAAGSFAPVIGNTIGGFVGGLLGGSGAAYIRYRFFKRGIRVTEALHTAEVRDATQTIAQGANDLANGTLPQSIQKEIHQIRQTATEAILQEVQKMVPLDQLDFAKMVDEGISVADAYRTITAKTTELINNTRNALETTQDILDSLSEADGVTERLQQLEKSIADEPRPRPVPKPRLNLQRRHQVQETAV
ncbi:RHS repeat-associated core domain-containing protein [Pseudomonas fluorescens]|uniref:RHS repeat-associated core domain-containing protein n=1 Tax=Pseudomonas fluorescens TaxID=294 RepID=UPI00054C16E1|nr:RHS repeat-associated core domain-containing protein [Pseudomonas fluorescens]KII35403.1 toxin [Pseudomonas fluorescens]